MDTELKAGGCPGGGGGRSELCRGFIDKKEKVTQNNYIDATYSAHVKSTEQIAKGLLKGKRTLWAHFQYFDVTYKGC